MRSVGIFLLIIGGIIVTCSSIILKDSTDNKISQIKTCSSILVASGSVLILLSLICTIMYLKGDKTPLFICSENKKTIDSGYNKNPEYIENPFLSKYNNKKLDSPSLSISDSDSDSLSIIDSPSDSIIDLPYVNVSLYPDPIYTHRPLPSIPSL